MHKVADLHVKGKSPQQYVDEVINALPEWGKSHHSIVRLGDQTALFAEAAPNSFLTALEFMLEGAPEQVAEIFESERDRFFGPSSPHVDFLWALEVIAWDPRYLNRAAVVLAKLGRLDPEPDSNHVNRPINSLRDILLGWSPNTYALQPQRIACLDVVLAACPDVGWQLLRKLLPRHMDSTSRTQHPKLRDLAPEEPEEITFGLVWDFEAAVVDRALAAAGDDENRLAVFVEAMGQLQPSNRAKVLVYIDSYLAAHHMAEGSTAKPKLLLGWSATRSTWDYVEGLGREVRDQYWRNLGSLPREGLVDDLLYAIDQLRSVERDIEVLGLMHRRSKDLPSSLLVDLLASGAGQVDDGLKRLGNMLSYYVALALKELRTRSDVEKLQIARLEYAYLPLLHHEREPLTIYGLLATDPEMFVDLMSHVFRGKNAPEDPVITDEMKARAKISYDLLSEFKNVPGLHDRKLDAQELAEWVVKVGALTAAKDLHDIGDQRIGFVLAHAPQDAEETFWPPSAVCQVIEAIASEQLESGFSIECFNKRGVYGKGINEGGGQERQLAARYKNWADATLMYPRTSAMLLAISDDWTRNAEHDDVMAEQNKMKT